MNMSDLKAKDRPPLHAPDERHDDIEDRMGQGKTPPGYGGVKGEGIDLAAIRGDLQNASERQYWRSLDELAGTAQFRRLLDREFSVGATEWPEDLSRRGFLQNGGGVHHVGGADGLHQAADA